MVLGRHRIAFEHHRFALIAGAAIEPIDGYSFGGGLEQQAIIVGLALPARRGAQFDLGAMARHHDDLIDGQIVAVEGHRLVGSWWARSARKPRRPMPAAPRTERGCAADRAKQERCGMRISTNHDDHLQLQEFILSVASRSAARTASACGTLASLRRVPVIRQPVIDFGRGLRIGEKFLARLDDGIDLAARQPPDGEHGEGQRERSSHRRKTPGA